MYSGAQKFKVAEYARHHGVRAAERHFSVHHTNVLRWMKTHLDKVPMKPGKRKQRKNAKGQGRKVSYPPEIVIEWILTNRETSYIPVSYGMIRLKALSLIRPVLPVFKASEGWCRKFLCRTNLVYRAAISMAQTLPADLERKISEFRQQVFLTRQNGDFAYSVVGNMDETRF